MNQSNFTELLENELLHATGCTEPIAISYAAAMVKYLLDDYPDEIIVYCSDKLIKNAQVVTVPGTNGLKGIAVAVAGGLVSGKPDLKLEVLTQLTDEDRKQISILLKKGIITIKRMETDHALHLSIYAKRGDTTVSVEIIDKHIQLGDVIKNGEYLKKRTDLPMTDKSTYKIESIQSILHYVETVPLEKIKNLIQIQIDTNSAICEEGLTNYWEKQSEKVLMF